MARLEWTDELKQQLSDLVAQGLSYRRAAAVMGIRHGQAKGAALYYGIKPATPRRPWRDWDRREYDQVEALLEQGLGYAQIGQRMGVSAEQAKGAAQRLGLMKRERLGAHRRLRDWPEIDRITRDCIEARLMTVPQAHSHLAALGHTLALSSLYRRVREDAELKRQADKNATRRKRVVGQRIQAARKARRKRQQEAA